MKLVCPLCDHQQDRPGDWCTCCGAYLGLIRRQPRRVARGILASIGLGGGLLLASAWQLFSPLLHGAPVGRPAWWMWWGLPLGILLLRLGLTARPYLRASPRPLLPAEAVEEDLAIEELRAKAG